MKAFYTFLLFSLASTSMWAQTDAQKMDSVKAQIAHEQYLTAFVTIETIQEGNTELILTVADLLINHSVGVNKDYDLWGMKNKTPDKNGSSDRINIDLEKLLWAYIKQNPSECRVYTAISKLYIKSFELEDLYIPLDVLTSIREKVQTYFPAKCADKYSAYTLGYSNNYLGQPESAISFLQKTIQLDPQYRPAYLELANSYLLTKNLPNALKNAKTAYDLSKSRSEKSKAALLMGQAYDGQKDNSNALKYYVMADTLARNEGFNQLALLRFYVKTGDNNMYEMINKYIGAQSRSNLHNYMDVFEIFTAFNRQNDLAAYLQKWLEKYKGREEIEACINFTLGKIYQKINASMANTYFKTAKDLGVKAERYPATRNHPNTGKEVENAFRNII